MVFTSSKIQAVGMLVISIAINLAFLIGIFTRPVISYHLSTPVGYNSTIDFSTEELRVGLHLRNMGLSPARVGLVARFYNMSFLETGSLSVEEYEAFSLLRLPWSVSAQQSEYDTFEVAFDSVENSSYLVLIYSIEADRKVRPISRFYNSFAIFKPERPTALLLKNIGDGKYMRVKKR